LGYRVGIKKKIRTPLAIGLIYEKRESMSRITTEAWKMPKSIMMSREILKWVVPI
jgi:hypothetical protein